MIDGISVLILTCRPITKTDPADGFWGIDASFRYGSASVILGTTAGVLDTGTSLIYIATGKITLTPTEYLY
jgi:cathepsin E